MEREISIALRFKLAIGDVTLNEIVYRLKEISVGLGSWDWGQVCS